MIRTSVLITLFALAACGPGEAGPPGPSGQKGDTGAQGPAGPAGASGVGLTKQTVCFGNQLFGSVAVTAVHARYDFADGSAFIYCELYVTNGGDKRKNSYPAFYKKTDPELATSKCVVNHDVNSTSGDGSGSFEFNIAPSAPIGRMIYHDPSPGTYDGTTTSLECESH